MVTNSPSGGVGRRLVARDTAIPSQAADLVGGEAFAGCCLSSLTIQDSGDHFIGVKGGQATQQRNRVFIRARSHGLELRTETSNVREGASTPAQRQVGVAFGPLEIQHHFFQQRAQEFLTIAVSGRRRTPYLANIGAEPLNLLDLRGADRAGTLLLSSP